MMNVYMPQRCSASRTNSTRLILSASHIMRVSSNVIGDSKRKMIPDRFVPIPARRVVAVRVTPCRAISSSSAAIIARVAAPTVRGALPMRQILSNRDAACLKVDR